MTLSAAPTDGQHVSIGQNRSAAQHHSHGTLVLAVTLLVLVLGPLGPSIRVLVLAACSAATSPFLSFLGLFS